MTEREFTDQVIELARLAGWRTAHFRAARTAKGWRTPVQGDGRGFPDLVLVKDSCLIFVELKVGRNRLTPEQEEWLDALCVPAFAFVWTPDDWAEIEMVLGVERVMV